MVEHVEESGRADHDKSRKYDAIEYSLGKEKSRKMQMQICERINLDEGDNCIGENLTTSFLSLTSFPSI